MSRVLLCGAFGQDNPGDDALLMAFLDALDGNDVVVASPTPIDRPDTTTVRPSALGLRGVLREVDSLVVAGGTVFKTLHPSANRHPAGLLARSAALLGYARMRGVPFALVGVGAGDLRSRTGIRLARWTAEHADLLILRDEESASVLAGIGAAGPFRIGADPAWTLFDGSGRSNEHERDGVVVAISHLADTEVDRLVERLVHVVEPLIAKGERVHLQPWQGDEVGADALVAHRLVRRLGDPPLVDVVARPQSLHDAVHCFARARAVVGLRHHALIAAAVAGCPFLAVAHEPKLAGIARRLGQSSVPPHATPAVLARSVVELLHHDPATPGSVAGEIDAARRSMRLLRVVVSRGIDEELVDRDRLELSRSGTPW
jgi:polysaccharide pyruvyl transferase WcaK-like protein